MGNVMGASGTTQPEALSARGFPAADRSDDEAGVLSGFAPRMWRANRPTFLMCLSRATSSYKVKKPVHFAFLDCFRLAQRFHYCCEEVRLNARLSPRVYLGVFAILKDAESFVLGPRVEVEHPDAVEYAVKMRRLP